MLRHSFEYGVGKSFKLKFVEMCVSSQCPMVLTVTDRKAFDLAGAQIPRVKSFSDDTYVFGLDLKPFVPVHTDRNGEIKLTGKTVGELSSDHPAEGSEPFIKFCMNATDLATKEKRGVEKVTAVTEKVVDRLIGFGVSIRLLTGGAGDRKGLKVIRLDVPVS